MQLKKEMSRREALTQSVKMALIGTLGAQGMLALTGCGGGGTASKASPFASTLTDEQTRALALNETNRKTQQAFITEVEPHLHLNADGTLAIDMQSSRVAGVSDGAIQFAQTAISQTNQFVKAGQISIDDKLNVHSTGISRANQNSWQWHWWGFTWLLNDERTGILSDFLIGLDYVDALKVLSVYAGGTLGVAAGSFLTVLVPIMFAWGWTFKYVNWSGGHRGIVINVTWATFIWAYSQ